MKVATCDWCATERHHMCHGCACTCIEDIAWSPPPLRPHAVPAPWTWEYDEAELARRLLLDNAGVCWDENAARLLRGILGSGVSQNETVDEMGVR